uniref:Odorant-binding protein 8 n=1 Tax=Rhyzopertha dominica TaxID=92692 RepID=A0A0X8RDN3_RHYDO|nr:odorant-binding protein 8 [Rhyzopertha dominica]
MEKCRRRFRPKVCCGEEVFAELHHSDEKRECFREIVGKDKDTRGPPPDPFKCEGRGKFRKNMMCVMNCVAKKKNLIDDDGNIKEDAIKSLFKSKFTDPAWTTELQDKIISTCMNEAKNPPPMPKDDANEQNECNPSLMVFSHCLFKEVQMQCPNEVITDQKSCERFRERVKNGDDMMMPPPPPPMDD